MSSSTAVEESIRVYHKPVEHRPGVHVLDIEWTDPDCQIHNRRVACSVNQLMTPHRPAYLCGETVPGVGQVLVSCPVIKEPTEEPQFSARLLRGVQDVVEIPVFDGQ